MSATLLVELFTEELPPKALKRLSAAFADGIASGLATRGLIGKNPVKTIYATPRRLAVRISSVLAKGEDEPIEQKLMPLSVARTPDGKASEALRKKLAGLGRAQLADGFPNAIDGPDSLIVKPDGRAESVYLRTIARGQPLARALDESLQEAIEKLPIPKIMSYQLADGATTVHFVRPVHGLIALHGDQVVDVSVLGLKADRITHGHRFQGVKDIPVATADAYEEALAAHGQVIASFDDRRAEIARQLADKAAMLKASLGAEADYTLLLDEVTALVEYPTVYVGEFGPEFLAVPQECLILTMRQNQKYFPLFDSTGRLVNKFLIVSNMKLEDPKNIIEGNQRVIRPRLADARFFFQTDKKTKLAERVPQLGAIVYHNKLGTQLERVGRVRALAQAIAQNIGADTALADRAALLAKADLVTNMVGEFPELQGIMGRYYALADGEDPRVADAIEQHYRPRFAGDALPGNDIATALALADKLETLAGMFGIGQQPTGDKDPLALRRHALGLIRILIEGDLPVSLFDLVNMAFSVFPSKTLGAAHTDLGIFIFERLRGHLRDGGYSANEVEAVLCMHPVRLNVIPHQLAAVRAFAELPEAQSLAAANKRVVNILKQAEAKGESFINAEAGMLKEPAERVLFDALRATSKQATLLFKQGDFTGYLKSFAVLKSPVDSFFDSVMVMVEDAGLRHNRLALLADLRKEMNQVADISKLAA